MNVSREEQGGGACLEQAPVAPTRRRVQARRVGLLSALIVAAGCCVWFGGAALVKLPWRVVTEVVIDGTEYASEERIRDAVAVQLGEPLFAVDTDSVVARVEAVPWVLRADVSRRLSGRLEVTVVERTPVGITWEDGFRLIDGTGYEAQFEGPTPPDVPIVSHLPETGALRSQTLLAVGSTLATIAKLPQLAPVVSELSVRDPDIIVLVLSPDAVPVWLPTRVGRDRLVALASLITHHPDVLRRARYVDARYLGRVAIK